MLILWTELVNFSMADLVSLPEGMESKWEVYQGVLKCYRFRDSTLRSIDKESSRV